VTFIAQAVRILIVTSTAKPNAGGEPRPIAAATQERRLLGVGSSARLGSPLGCKPEQMVKLPTGDLRQNPNATVNPK